MRTHSSGISDSGRQGALLPRLLRYDLTIDDWGKDSHANKVRVGDGLVKD